MNPICHLPWTWFEIDLDRKKVRSCCKTDWLENHDNFMFLNKAIVQRRVNFLNQVKDPDCDHCWKLEDAGQPSYRQYVKINPHLQTNNFSLDQAVPKTLSINLGSLCNIACSYCDEYYSTVWATEKNIPIKLDHGNHFEANILRWLEEIVSNDQLSHIIFIGGEPTVNPSFYKILDIVSEVNKKRKNTLRITVQTNGIFKNNIDRIINSATGTLHFSYRFSMDGLYRRAEFIRTGLKWNEFENNFLALLRAKNKNLSVAVHPTLSLYSLGGMQDFLSWLDQLDNDWQDLGFNHIEHPDFMALKTLGADCQKLMKNTDKTFRNSKLNLYVKRAENFLKTFKNVANYDIVKKGLETQENRSGIAAQDAVPELVELIWK